MNFIEKHEQYNPSYYVIKSLQHGQHLIVSYSPDIGWGYARWQQQGTDQEGFPVYTVLAAEHHYNWVAEDAIKAALDSVPKFDNEVSRFKERLQRSIAALKGVITRMKTR
jgi:hypothetical protein